MHIKQDAIPFYVPQGTSINLSHKRPNNFGRFQAVGEFSTTDKEEKYDVLETMGQLSKGAQRLFLIMKRHRDDCNRIALPRQHKIGSVAYKSKMRLCKEIRALNLVALVKRPHVQLLDLDHTTLEDHHLLMLNPSFIRCRNQVDAQIFWKAVTRD